MKANQQTLVLSDGGLPAFLASAIAAEEVVVARAQSSGGIASAAIAQVVFVREMQGEMFEEAVARAIRNQSQQLGLDADLRLPSARTKSQAEHRYRYLGEAVFRAAEAGIGRVIWPVAPVGDGAVDAEVLDRVAEACDQAVLIGRYASLGGSEITIETPFLDLSDADLADLFVDMGLAESVCWWWGGGVAPASEIGVAEHRRWSSALALARGEAVATTA